VGLINMRALSQGRSVSRIAARGSRTAVPRLTGRGLRAAAPRLGADDSKPDGPVHFRNTPTSHPLGVDKWVNPTINHVWSEAEVDQRLATQPRHTPVLISEKIAHGFLQMCYKTFNLVTGYKAADPTPDSVAFRLIFLESVAGVPGMVAAQHRHFRSLRSLERDYGWIHTLLEEAENERMHLLTFLKMFPPGPFTRFSIFFTQFGFGALFISLYITSPPTAHRLVGYIEEMAVVTCTCSAAPSDLPDVRYPCGTGRRDPLPTLARRLNNTLCGGCSLRRQLLRFLSSCDLFASLPELMRSRCARRHEPNRDDGDAWDAAPRCMAPFASARHCKDLCASNVANLHHQLQPGNVPPPVHPHLYSIMPVAGSPRHVLPRAVCARWQIGGSRMTPTSSL